MQRLNSRGDRWPACAQAMHEMAHQPVFFVFILLIICLFYIRKPTHLSIWTRGSDMYHHLTVYFFSSDHFSTIPTLHLGVSVRSYLVNPPPLVSPSLPLSILFDPLSILHCLVTVEKEGVHMLSETRIRQGRGVSRVGYVSDTDTPGIRPGYVSTACPRIPKQ